jgi:cytokinin dehydrogenase
MRFNAMDGVGEPDTARSTVTASPGALWRSVLSTTAPRGFAPEVLPLYLDLTVGGTLAVGGIGSTSHRYGAAVSSVEELEVVTGGAEIIRCGAERETALFGAVLGGIGRYGVITSATLRLRRITPFVRTFTLLYDDLSLWLADQRLLIGSGRAEYIEGFCTASAQGYRTTSSGKRPFAEWFYGLVVSVGFDTPGLSAAETVLKGLRHRRLSNTEDEVHETFLSRLDTAIAIARKTGAFQRPHPHFEVLLPGEALPELLPQILDALPLALGDGHRLLFVRPDRLPRSFVAPRSGEIALLAIRPEGVQEMFLLESLDALRKVHSLCTAAGGTMYLPGWLGMMDAGAWRTHFGDLGAELTRLRHRYDPDDVFHSYLHSSIPES